MDRSDRKVTFEDESEILDTGSSEVPKQPNIRDESDIHKPYVTRAGRQVIPRKIHDV